VRFVVPLFFQTGFFVSNRSFGATFIDFADPKGIRAASFGGNPSNLPASEWLCEPISAAVRFKGISGNTVQATPKSPK
ncbi:hypothetical protein, partial [Streptosporangium pseudovulgare]|uniref:hypothetical protein n=1 Tax=Streptosporangium pseudovulgare TaxID=35765 RepID=UPI001E4B1554